MNELTMNELTMNELKYVILIPAGMNEMGARAILFNGLMNHKDAVHALLSSRRFRLHSAGFCTIFPNVKAWGRSESLNIESAEGDADIINRTLRHQHTLTDVLAYK